MYPLFFLTAITATLAAQSLTCPTLPVPKGWHGTLNGLCKEADPRCVPLAGTNCLGERVDFVKIGYQDYSLRSCEVPPSSTSVFWRSIECGLGKQLRSSPEPTPSAGVPDRKIPTASTEAECISKGGLWMGTTEGRGRLTGCNLPTSDGGKSCSDSSQCESVCYRGKCAGRWQVKGCGILMGGNSICID